MSNVSCYIIIDSITDLRQKSNIDLNYNIVYTSLKFSIIEPKINYFNPIQVLEKLSFEFKSPIYMSFIDEDYFSILSCYKGGQKVFFLHKDFNSHNINDEEIYLTNLFFSDINNKLALNDLIEYYSTDTSDWDSFIGRKLLYSILEIDEDDICIENQFTTLSAKNMSYLDLVKTNLTYTLRNTEYRLLKSKIFDCDCSFLKEEDGFYTGLTVDIQYGCIYPHVITNHCKDTLFELLIPLKFDNEIELLKIIDVISEEFLSAGLAKIESASFTGFDYQLVFVENIIPIFQKKGFTLINRKKYNYTTSRITFIKDDYKVTLIHWPEYPNVTCSYKKGSKIYYLNIDNQEFQSLQTNYRFKSKQEYILIINKFLDLID